MQIEVYPLPENLLGYVWDHARRWKPSVSSAVDGVLYLEDRLAQVTVEGENPVEMVAMGQFYATVLLRYLNKSTGSPDRVQILSSYDTPNGNQVDRFLAEFFEVT